MDIYVREIGWMWNKLHLSLAECRVYAYIYGLSHGVKGGYDGSKRHLAELLGLDEKSVRNVLNTLMEKNLILSADGLWRSADLVRSSNADSVRESAELLRNNADSVRSPQTPLYNNKLKTKQADMQTEFEKFWKYFDPAPEFMNRRAATQMIFESRSDAARKALIEAAQEGGGHHPGDQQNPYFYVQDFPEPQPIFLSGQEQDQLRKEGIPLVQVIYFGKYLVCTRDTMNIFGLKFVRDW